MILLVPYKSYTQEGHVTSSILQMKKTEAWKMKKVAQELGQN